MEEAIPWEGHASQAAWGFGRRCADLSRSNPHELVALEWIINALMTELWDHGFSQFEIRTAFEKAIADMPRYAAGQERRG
jgi:hypothetical protein